MIDQFKQAKKNREILHFKNFQNVDFSWDTILNFLFEETKKENKEIVILTMQILCDLAQQYFTLVSKNLKM